MNKFIKSTLSLVSCIISLIVFFNHTDLSFMSGPISLLALIAASVFGTAFLYYTGICDYILDRTCLCDWDCDEDDDEEDWEDEIYNCDIVYREVA